MKRKNLLLTALGLSVLIMLVQTTIYSHQVLISSFQAAQQPDEGESYKAFYDANAAKDLPKAYELAKKYLKDFPTGKYAEYLKNKYIPNTRITLFNQASTAKNSDVMISLGNEVLAENPDDLDFLLPLAQHLNINEINAKPPITTHAAEAEAFTRRAVKLLEEGKKPAEGSGWKVNETLAYFYQILGMTEEKKKNLENALAFFEKAGGLDTSSSFAYLHSGGILQERYLKAAEKYQALPDTEKNSATPSEQTKTLLKEVNDAADTLLDRWIKFLKLTATNNPYGATRGEVETTVAGIYKYRHPESPEAFRELIKP